YLSYEWMRIGKHLTGHAHVVEKHFLYIRNGGGLHIIIRVGPPAHKAATVPSIRWVVQCPELVCDRQYGTFERPVSFAHAATANGHVLQLTSTLAEAIPLGGSACRLCGVVILSLQPVDVVLF